MIDMLFRDAVISPDKAYRYSLLRYWGTKPGLVTYVMLNPSTADAWGDDATVIKCMNLADRLGYTTTRVVNLYAFRASKPTDLWKAEDPVGPDNNAFLEFAAWDANDHDAPIIAGWGTNAKQERVQEVLQIPGMDRLQALQINKGGSPKHPLYIPYSATLVPWPGEPT